MTVQVERRCDPELFNHENQSWTTLRLDVVITPDTQEDFVVVGTQHNAECRRLFELARDWIVGRFPSAPFRIAMTWNEKTEEGRAWHEPDATRRPIDELVDSVPGLRWEHIRALESSASMFDIDATIETVRAIPSHLPGWLEGLYISAWESHTGTSPVARPRWSRLNWCEKTIQDSSGLLALLYFHQEFPQFPGILVRTALAPDPRALIG